jgi:hypothetical protein
MVEASITRALITKSPQTPAFGCCDGDADEPGPFLGPPPDVDAPAVDTSPAGANAEAACEARGICAHQKLMYNVDE